MITTATRRMLLIAALILALDQATKNQIERGRRITELLKQNQYVPMAMEHQVVVLYAATKGYVDAIAVEKIRDWEDGLHEYLDESA